MTVVAVALSAAFSVPADAAPAVVDQYTEQVPTAGGPTAGGQRPSAPGLDGSAKKPEGSSRLGAAGEAPAIGADIADVLSEEGFSGDEISALVEAGLSEDEISALRESGDAAGPGSGSEGTGLQVSSSGYGMGLLFPLLLLLVAGLVVALAIGRRRGAGYAEPER